MKEEINEDNSLDDQRRWEMLVEVLPPATSVGKKEKEKEVPCRLHRLVDEVVEPGLGTIRSAPDFNCTHQVTQRSELSERARAT